MSWLVTQGPPPSTVDGPPFVYWRAKPARAHIAHDMPLIATHRRSGVRLLLRSLVTTPKPPKNPKPPPPRRKTPWSKFRNTTIYRTRGTSETFLDVAAMARVRGQIQALWDYEKNLTIVPGLDGIDQLDDANHLRSRRTLDGNPYGLTKGQHLIPREHLSWFARSDGQVYVLHKDFPRVKPFHPTAVGLFCADRLWTQKEELTSHPIEETFYKEVARANGALDSRAREIELSQEAITKYWALVRSRVRVHAYPPRPYNLAEQVRDQFPQAEKDENEHEGFAMYSAEGDETRADADVMIQILMQHDCKDVEERGVRWCVGVCEENDRLVLPDLFPRFAVPIAHDRMFYGVQNATSDTPAFLKATNPDEFAVMCFNESRRFIVARAEEALLKIRPNGAGVAIRGPKKTRKQE